MIGTILLFELKNRLASFSTYLYFALFFAIAFLFTVVSGGAFPALNFGAAADGKVMVNSPFALHGIISGLSFFAIMIVAAVAGQATYQDVDNRSEDFFYTAPISKLDYLAGRFLGAVVTLLAILSSIGIGAWIGAHMPFLDPTKVGPDMFAAYVQPYLNIVLPNIVIFSAIFFALATLGKKMLPVYAGGILLLIGYLFVIQILADPTRNSLFTLVDPFGRAATGRLTQYWTPFERNHQLIPLSGILLENRLVWLGVAVAMFVFTYFRFSRAYGSASRGKRIVVTQEASGTSTQSLPVVHTVFSTAASWSQLFSLTWLQFMETVKNVFFFVILLGGFLLALFIATSNIDPLSSPPYPLTSVILQAVIGGFGLFVLIIVIFYSGELVWRERDAKVNQIVDAMPVQRWVLFSSKLGALMLVQVLIAVIMMLSALSVQIASGYHRFEFGLYFKELFVVQMIPWWILCVVGLLLHTLVNQKFIGHFAVILYYIVQIATAFAGWSNYLYRFGEFPNGAYSDMNGFGPFVVPRFWFGLYWVLAAIVLAVVTGLLWVRGVDSGFKQRLSLARERLTPATLGSLALLAALFLATGAYIFYNTEILHHYRTEYQQAEIPAQYERKYRSYQDLPQPKITDISAAIDLYPEKRSAHIQGSYWLQNKTEKPIDRVALTMAPRSQFTIKELAFEGGQTPVVEDKDLGFYVYRLTSALPPGQKVQLKFTFQFDNRGFSNSDPNVNFAQNGSYVDNNYLPAIGYLPGEELGDETIRRRHGLGKPRHMATLEDVAARQDYFRSDSDWVNLEATVSTSADQTAILPGYLQKEWTQDGRHYFHYKMDAPIVDLFALSSARYAVLRDRWNDVNLEIYYHPDHQFNVDHMRQSMKETLDYCSAHFSPYQFHQLRIIEIPRYYPFAISFANTINFSEGIGFTTKVEPKKVDSIDVPLYITAHEIGHQWWAHQEAPADVEGAAAVSETLAQYTALMVMQHHYGAEKMKKFLHQELTRYLVQRTLEHNEERPLYRVERQPYVYYEKGGLVMYALQDYIGEDKVDQALADFMKQFRFKGAPYATSQDLIEQLRKVTPPEYQSLIDDLFEHITFYESRAVSSTYSKQPDGRYRVHLATSFKKYQSDGSGEQKDAPIGDWIDIGVLDDQGQFLYLKKHKIERENSEFDLVVDKLPAKAGIDPLNKLIDRKPDDNLVKVTQQ
ncbi:MAG TPA: M1 family aminopeptidase [Candidatus Angelobacter sp.]|nr:M1 family aminopeptidase [Candidatus Angelobacter sp.]